MMDQPKQITKTILQNIHRRQIMNEQSNDMKKEDIIVALGGIDHILSMLFESNAVITSNQLQSLHRIIDISYPSVESSSLNEQTQKKQITLTFYDDDMLLYSLFSEKTATNIIRILNSKITFILLILILIIFGITALLRKLDVLSTSFVDLIWSVFLVMVSIYCFGWILCANKIAMKRLFKSFECWFKIYYLIQYVVIDSCTERIEGISIYFICTSFISMFCTLFLVMILEAINIKQTNKIIVSSLVLGAFANSSLYFSRIASYRTEYTIYEEATITISGVLGFGPFTFNYYDIAANSAQILAIFLGKQMISSIIKPTKASVIKITPFIVWENQKLNAPTTQTIKTWKRFTISCIVFLFLLWCVVSVGYGYWDERPFFTLLFTLLVFSTICLMLTGKIKFLWTANLIMCINLILFCFAVYLFKWSNEFVFGPLIGCGLISDYTLKVSEFEEHKMVQNVNGVSHSTDEIERKSMDHVSRSSIKKLKQTEEDERTTRNSDTNGQVGDVGDDKKVINEASLHEVGAMTDDKTVDINKSTAT